MAACRWQVLIFLLYSMYCLFKFVLNRCRRVVTYVLLSNLDMQPWRRAQCLLSVKKIFSFCVLTANGIGAWIPWEYIEVEPGHFCLFFSLRCQVFYHKHRRRSCWFIDFLSPNYYSLMMTKLFFILQNHGRLQQEICKSKLRRWISRIKKITWAAKSITWIKYHLFMQWTYARRTIQKRQEKNFTTIQVGY